MKTKVKTIWGPGIVSVADKYVQKAIKLKEDLEIVYNGVSMVVDKDTLKERKPRSVGFRDRFGRQKMYQLYDFFWETK